MTSIINSAPTVRTATELDFHAIVSMFSPAEGNNRGPVAYRFVIDYGHDLDTTLCLPVEPVDWTVQMITSTGTNGDEFIFGESDDPGRTAALLTEEQLLWVRVESHGNYVITAFKADDGSWTLEYQRKYPSMDYIGVRHYQAAFERVVEEFARRSFTGAGVKQPTVRERLANLREKSAAAQD